MTLELDPRLAVAAASAAGVGLVAAGIVRWQRRRRMRRRVSTLAAEPGIEPTWTAAGVASSLTPRLLAGRLGARLATRMPDQVGTLAGRVDRAGLSGRAPTVELLGWKAVGVLAGAAMGIASTLRFGAPGLIVLGLGLLVGWFAVDLALAQHHQHRRRQILRDLPTVMDLLVLSLEAGMGLDRALRTIVAEYRSAVADEIRRVLADIDLGIARGDAFERMAVRVGLEDLRALSRAIIQSEELGLGLVSVMQTQSREIRLSRRRAAEAEALRAPIKMLVPLVLFILPTLFMLLLAPVGLRAAAALTGNVP